MNEKTLEGNAFFVTAYFVANGDRLQLAQISDPSERELQAAIPRGQELSVRDIEGHLTRGFVKVDEASATSLPESLTRYNLNRYIRQFGCESAAFIPIMQDAEMRGLVMIGARAGQIVNDAVIDSFLRAIRLTTKVVAKTETPSRPAGNERQRLETRALNVLASNATTQNDLNAFYGAVHDQFKNVIGDLSFLIASYNPKTNSISVPYLYEEGRFQTIEEFPLGEGLTSRLIRTREPLLIVEDTEKRMTDMGAKFAGRPAKSWMGVPLLTRGEAIGAIILQDLDRERAFDEDDLRFAMTAANQIAETVHNIRLLRESQQLALQFETAAEIARDISGSLNLDELLLKAVDLVRSRFDYYYAAVLLTDLPGESVAVREASGEAGAQLKRSGFKVQVGSRSIIGAAADKGEALVANDVSRDPLYQPHPSLPETKSEASIPLKVGERILGVLDVQSDRLYAFSSDNLRILHILADQLAIAVINSELFAETQEHLAQHRLLHHITTTAASGTTLDEALRSAVNGLQVTLGGDRVAILLIDREKQNLEVKATVGYGEEVYRKVVPIGSGITGWSALHRRPLRVGNVLQDSRYIEASPNTRSELAIPLLYRSELLGVLNVESEQIAAYAENDEELLGTLGGSLAAIIANARLLEQIRSQAERERILFEITDKIRRTTDMQTILATTASELTRAVGASGARIKLGVHARNAARLTEGRDE
ncbi:MAG: GAF domain-containing protein [Anaerolineales bacterium]|nr:GAF domain-containing protein [Anaerolineales bacterium]